MKGLQLSICVLFLLLSLGAAVHGATISATDLTLASSGSSGTVDIQLDQASTGLAGYQLEVSINPAGTAEFSSVNFPAAFSMNSASTLPASSVSIVAVDLMDQIKAGASSVKLATLNVHGLADGSSEVQIAITELTDDNGNPVSSTIQPGHVTVGSGVPTPTPTGEPTPVPTTPVPTPTQSVGPTPVPTTPVPTPTQVPAVEPTSIPTEDPTHIPSVEPEPLVAAFTAQPMTGTPPLTVKFTDHSTGSPKKWRWDFGDGTTSTEQNPRDHVYGGIGRYTVTLEVISDNFSSIERRPEIIRVVGDYPVGPSGFVMVTSQPSGSVVNMSGVYLGTTPATLIVPAGSRSLTFEKEGYQKKTVNVTIRPNEMKLIPKVILKAAS